MFFVLGGVMTVQLGEHLHDVAAGGLAWGVRHPPSLTWPRSDHPARAGNQGRAFAQFASVIDPESLI